MNRQTFLNYLEEPSKLYQLPLVELQGLVLEFPYSPNLRLLLLLKARLEDHPRQEEMLQQLAARTFDREYLHDLIRELDHEAAREAAGKVERLELQDLDKLDFAFIANNNQSDDVQEQPLSAAIHDQEATASANFDGDSFIAPLNQEMEAPTTSLQEEVDNDPVIEDEKIESVGSTAIDDKRSPVYSSDLLLTAASVSELLAGEVTHFSFSIPEPVEHLVDIDAESTSTNKLKARLRRHRKKQLVQLRHREQDRLKEIARQSISAHDEVASETLAKLLTMQGQYAKAIKMYQRLSLQNPEKSANFAGLIQELKEKL